MRPYKFRMRLSSRRLNVTRFGTAPTATWCAAARDSLGSRSSEIKLMVRLLAIFGDDMIAPTAALRKGRISVALAGSGDSPLHFWRIQAAHTVTGSLVES